MLRGRFTLKKDKEVEEAIAQLVEVTGWRRWFAKNIITWRRGRKLPIFVGKVLP